MRMRVDLVCMLACKQQKQRGEGSWTLMSGGAAGVMMVDGGLRALACVTVHVWVWYVRWRV